MDVDDAGKYQQTRRIESSHCAAFNQIADFAVSDDKRLFGPSDATKDATALNTEHSINLFCQRARLMVHCEITHSLPAARLPARSDIAMTFRRH